MVFVGSQVIEWHHWIERSFNRFAQSHEVLQGDLLALGPIIDQLLIVVHVAGVGSEGRPRCLRSEAVQVPPGFMQEVEQLEPCPRESDRTSRVSKHLALWRWIHSHANLEGLQGCARRHPLRTIAEVSAADHMPIVLQHIQSCQGVVVCLGSM